MNKKNVEAPLEEQHSLPNIKSYSINEILAAGGPDAFSKKMGKSWKGFLDRLNNLPKDVLLSEEEFAEAMKTLDESK